MHPNPRVIAPIVVVAVLAVAVWTFISAQQDATVRNQTVSGTIEATEIQLGSQTGGEVKQVYVDRGDNVRQGQPLADLFSAPHGASTGSNDKIISPINGVVLERYYEVGEIVTAGATVVTVADLNRLTLTIYVPEDRYGEISLGQVYQVTVDSFPGETFEGKVTHIATEAEFTPRNVQTIEKRKTTVYGIELSLEPSGGRLKPGMPADVRLDKKS